MTPTNDYEPDADLALLRGDASGARIGVWLLFVMAACLLGTWLQLVLHGVAMTPLLALWFHGKLLLAVAFVVTALRTMKLRPVARILFPVFAVLAFADAVGWVVVLFVFGHGMLSLFAYAIVPMSLLGLVVTPLVLSSL